jgi:hypothetical protein
MGVILIILGLFFLYLNGFGSTSEIEVADDERRLEALWEEGNVDGYSRAYWLLELATRKHPILWRIPGVLCLFAGAGLMIASTIR